MRVAWRGRFENVTDYQRSCFEDEAAAAKLVSMQTLKTRVSRFDGIVKILR